MCSIVMQSYSRVVLRIEKLTILHDVNKYMYM